MGVVEELSAPLEANAAPSPAGAAWQLPGSYGGSSDVANKVMQVKACILGAVVAMDNDFHRLYVFNLYRHLLYRTTRSWFGGLIAKWLFFLEITLTKGIKMVVGAKYSIALVTLAKKWAVAASAIKSATIGKALLVAKVAFTSAWAKLGWTLAALYGGV